MLNREQCHRLLDAVLDITESGEGEMGHPFVYLKISNYGIRQEVDIIDNGFHSRETGYDGVYEFDNPYHQNKDERYKDCMKHMQRLKKQIRREKE